jgi:opacity protein-like surface antigen
MKKLLALASFVALFSVAAFAQTGAQITFEKLVHDYGTIVQDADGNCEFKFKNTGNEPLIISGAKGSCGCTVPEWSKEPIAPGQSGSIKVKYDTKRIGKFSKTVTVTSNAVNGNNGTITLTIQGNVEAPGGSNLEKPTPAGSPTVRP